MRMVNRKSSATLPEQVKSDVEFKIAKGLWQPGERIPSEDALAEEYGISRMTVRHALIELVSNGMLCRVPGKGTFVSSIVTNGDQRDFGSNGNEYVALIVQNLGATFPTEIVGGAQECLVRNGAEMLIRITNNDLTLERSFLQELTAKHVSGLILIACSNSGVNADLLRSMNKSIPVVVADMDCKEIGIDSVVSDDENGGYQITNHLLELGHRKILHIAGDPAGSSAIQRLAGYRRALLEFGLDYDEDLVRYAYSWNVTDGYSETKKYLASVESREEMATAIFACSDVVACGVYRLFGELGMKIPSDVAVVGYGDLSIDQLVEPPMTTVDQSPRTMGRMAAQLVIDKLRGNRLVDEVSNLVVPTRMVARHSCGVRYSQVSDLFQMV